MFFIILFTYYLYNYCLQTYLKDNFERPQIDKTQWSVVEGGDLGKSCENLVEGSALVMSGPVNRQLVTVDLDLRDAKYAAWYCLLFLSPNKI